MAVAIRKVIHPRRVPGSAYIAKSFLLSRRGMIVEYTFQRQRVLTGPQRMHRTATITVFHFEHVTGECTGEGEEEGNVRWEGRGGERERRSLKICQWWMLKKTCSEVRLLTNPRPDRCHIWMVPLSNSGRIECTEAPNIGKAGKASKTTPAQRERISVDQTKSDFTQTLRSKQMSPHQQI